MVTLTSLAEIQKTGITLRPEEAVAIVQQLIHNPVEIDSRTASSFGPPSSENVFVDDEGVVTCQTCASTPAVFEIAILLQALLPPGTPAVPGALRYTIARALLDVDAPPFDSVAALSETLARFERGDRTAVVRALVARAQSVCLDRMRLTAPDRRRLMPTATEFRRELRAADARYYELVGAEDPVAVRQAQDDPQPPPRTVGPVAETPVRPCAAPPPPQPRPERRRVSALAVGVAVGLGLIRVGEFLHTRATPFRAAVAAAEPAPDRNPTPIAPPPRQEAARVPSIPAPAPVPVATTGSRVEKRPVAKRAVRRARPAPAAAPRERRTKGSLMDRAPLRWLRNAFTVRSEPL